MLTIDETICRGCLRKDGKKSLYDKCKAGDNLSTRFLECTGINAMKDLTVAMPHKLCDVCYNKLQDSHSFRLLCIHSDDIIKRHFDKSSDEVSPDCEKVGEHKGISDEKSSSQVKDKNIQELHFSDDFQFVYKPKQKKKNRLTKHMCEVCGYRANDAYTLKLHSNTHIDIAEKIHTCHICHKKFATPVSLKCHTSRHNTSNSFMCEECGVRFSTAAHLRTHKKSTHSGLRPHTCSLCSRTFALRSNLTVHQKIHAGIKPHKCQTCGKCFTTTSDLKGHIRSHSGEKPHVCNVCQKAFSLRSNLNVHMRTHHQNNTLLTYSCTQCERKFTSKASLKSHHKTHSGVRLHACTICSARFTHSNTLRSHQTVHTGQRDHACTQCDKKFSRASILKTHLKKHNKQTLNANGNNNINDKGTSAEYSNRENLNINSSLCERDKYNKNKSQGLKIKCGKLVLLSQVQTQKDSSTSAKTSNVDSSGVINTNTTAHIRNTTVIESGKKSNDCVLSNREKNVVIPEQTYNVHLGTTHSPLTYIPVVAVAQPILHVQHARVQPIDVVPTTQPNNTHIYTLQPGSVESNTTSSASNVRVIRPNNILVSNCQPATPIVTSTGMCTSTTNLNPRSKSQNAHQHNL